MSITAKMLAKQLNLSEAAISMALNNKPGVSTATRKRVIEAARAAGYDFSGKEKTGNIKKGSICFAVFKKSGAIVGDTPFFSDLTDGVNIGCKRAGYDCVTRYFYSDEDLEGELNLLDGSHFEGIILLATEADSFLMTRFSKFKTPLVILDAYADDLNLNCVIINNVRGAYLATRHLIARCACQPGYLRSSYPISNFEARADGFYKAIRAVGMSTSRSTVYRLTPSEAGAYADMQTLLSEGITPERCFFADNDLIAIGAIRAFKEAGYRIPEDVAIVGFDDIPICDYMTPPLTTIHVPKQAMGETAVRRLITMIEDRDATPVTIEIGTILRKRKSV